ncbi:hypothetical protein ClosIBUN13A_CONTIG102g01312 [Clostridium sp. IBUN13A]|nr:hypothetical protein ClosIBUN13A_CONTIG102g01312 [Clostridium sp. IBUN13A]
MHKFYLITKNKLVKECVYMKFLNITALTLIIIGAINWGLIGLLQYNLVDSIFGIQSMISRIIYALVGLAGIYSISFFMKK